MTGIVLISIGCLLAIVIGLALLKRSFSRLHLLPEEVALSVAWVFLVGSLVWLAAYAVDYPLLGYTAPWTWLAAAHFAVAGFGGLTITALTCRSVSNKFWLRVLRVLLFVHPIAYLVTASGISGLDYSDQIGATLYEMIFVVQLCAFLLGGPSTLPTGPRRLVGLSLAVPVLTLTFALAWAWGSPIFDLDEMVWFHGIANAVGHIGLGFIGFGWGRPASHSPLRRPV
jgi:hypothetical protein